MTVRFVELCKKFEVMMRVGTVFTFHSSVESRLRRVMARVHRKFADSAACRSATLPKKTSLISIPMNEGSESEGCT